MRVAYRLDNNDLLAYIEFICAHDRAHRAGAVARRRHNYATVGTFLVVGTALLYDTVRVYRPSGVMPWLTLIIGTMSILTGLGIIGDEPRRRARNMSTWLAQAREKLGGEEIVVSLNDDGISYTAKNTCALYRWDSDVDGILETPARIFIPLHAGGAITLPKTAFASEAERSAFLARARDHLARAGGPIGLRDLLRYLAVNDEPCPACGYNLRAITQPRCPECGRQIVGRDIPNFVKFGPPALPPRGGAAPTNLD